MKVEGMGVVVERWRNKDREREREIEREGQLPMLEKTTVGSNVASNNIASVKMGNHHGNMREREREREREK